jgi:hypothetical protein
LFRFGYLCINQLSISEEREVFVPLSYKNNPKLYFWRRVTSFDLIFVRIITNLYHTYCLKRLKPKQNDTFYYIKNCIEKEKSLMPKFNAKHAARRSELTYQFIKTSGQLTKESKRLNNLDDKTNNLIALSALFNFKYFEKIIHFSSVDIDVSQKSNILLNENIKFFYQHLYLKDPSKTGTNRFHYYFNMGLTMDPNEQQKKLREIQNTKSTTKKENQAQQTELLETKKPIIPTIQELIKQVYKLSKYFILYFVLNFQFSIFYLFSIRLTMFVIMD